MGGCPHTTGSPPSVQTAFCRGMAPWGKTPEVCMKATAIQIDAPSLPGIPLQSRVSATRTLNQPDSCNSGEPRVAFVTHGIWITASANTLPPSSGRPRSTTRKVPCAGATPDCNCILMRRNGLGVYTATPPALAMRCSAQCMAAAGKTSRRAQRPARYLWCEMPIRVFKKSYDTTSYNIFFKQYGQTSKFTTRG